MTRALNTVPEVIPLEDRQSRLIEICLSWPPCAKLLRRLNARRQSLMTLDDIAGYLDVSLDEAATVIQSLEETGALCRVSAGTLVFYGLTEDQEKRRMLDRLVRSCDEWHRR